MLVSMTGGTPPYTFVPTVGGMSDILLAVGGSRRYTLISSVRHRPHLCQTRTAKLAGNWVGGGK